MQHVLALFADRSCGIVEDLWAWAAGRGKVAAKTHHCRSTFHCPVREAHRDSLKRKLGHETIVDALTFQLVVAIEFATYVPDVCSFNGKLEAV